MTQLCPSFFKFRHLPSSPPARGPTRSLPFFYFLFCYFLVVPLILVFSNLLFQSSNFSLFPSTFLCVRVSACLLVLFPSPGRVLPLHAVKTFLSGANFWFTIGFLHHKSCQVSEFSFTPCFGANSLILGRWCVQVFGVPLGRRSLNSIIDCWQPHLFSSFLLLFCLGGFCDMLPSSRTRTPSRTSRSPFAGFFSFFLFWSYSKEITFDMLFFFGF